MTEQEERINEMATAICLGMFAYEMIVKKIAIESQKYAREYPEDLVITQADILKTIHELNAKK